MADETRPEAGAARATGSPPDELAAAEDAVHEAEAQLADDLDALLRERDDLLDTSRRLQADFENYRKRMMREQGALVDRATEGLIEALLPVLDSFEAARSQLEGDVDPESVRKGVELVFGELRSVLERHGLEPIGTPGAPFDPSEHEAVMQEPGEGAPVVADVMRAGYRLKGRVLRPAMVKVAHGGDPVEG